MINIGIIESTPVARRFIVIDDEASIQSNDCLNRDDYEFTKCLHLFGRISATAIVNSNHSVQGHSRCYVEAACTLISTSDAEI